MVKPRVKQSEKRGESSTTRDRKTYHGQADAAVRASDEDALAGEPGAHKVLLYPERARVVRGLLGGEAGGLIRVGERSHRGRVRWRARGRRGKRDETRLEVLVLHSTY